MDLGVESADRRVDHAAHRDALHFEDRHLAAPGARGGGDLEADVAAADDDDPSLGLEAGADGEAILDGAQIENPGELGARQREPAHHRAGGEQELVVGELGAVVERHAAGATVDLLGPPAEHQLDVRFVVEVGRLEEDPLELDVAGQKLLRQRRPLVGHVRLVAHQDDAAAEPAGAQAGDGLAGGVTGTDDEKCLLHLRFPTLCFGDGVTRPRGRHGGRW